MAYDTLRRRPSREHIYVAEIDGEFCDLTYSVAPCEAAIGVTGSEECFNTFKTCQDTDNYTETGITYRFCEPMSPHPVGLNGVIPSLRSVNITPAEINPGGGLGVRSSLTLTFDDHPYHDRGLDKYVDNRNYIATDRGSYWTKWRARNPFYRGFEVRLISAYLDDNGEYDLTNGQTRVYIIESVDVANGTCTIKAKDPLKALDDERIKIPTPSTGQLAADITDAQTSFDVAPAGEGANYTAGDKIRIGREVMLIDSVSVDTLTVTRAQHNTEADEHDQDDTVQICKEYSSMPLDEILVDIVHEAFPPPMGETYHPFIDINQWESEVDNFLPGAYSTLITEPTGATKLLNELGEQIPHSLYWDERFAKLFIKAIRQPPSNAPVLTEDGHMLDTISVKDMQDLRRSTVFVYFGQIDPTEKLDEGRNYRQTYVREDTDSVDNYGSRRIKEVFSRWISNVNKAAAVRAATRIGRRWADAPREVDFRVTPKDSGVWAGDPIFLNHRQLPDFTGAPVDTPFQITSVREVSDNTFRYRALEHLYGQSLPDDEEPGLNDVILSGELYNVDLLESYESTVGTPDGSTAARFIIEATTVIGSQDITLPSVTTGTWPAGATIDIIINGVIVGKGGKGGEGETSDHTDGGDAINLEHDVTIDNGGLIGGGGGGGASNFGVEEGVEQNPGGGGGAGALAGAGGRSFSSNPSAVIEHGEDGTQELGGDGGSVDISFTAFDGGDLGVDASTGGVAGFAIRQNGHTVTYTNTGDIRGTTA